MSVSRCVEKGLIFRASQGKCVFLRDNIPQVFGHLRNGLYELEFEVIVSSNSLAEANAASSGRPRTIQEWNECLAHQDKRHVQDHLKRREISFTVTKIDAFYCIGFTEATTS